MREAVLAVPGIVRAEEFRSWAVRRYGQVQGEAIAEEHQSRLPDFAAAGGQSATLVLERDDGDTMLVQVSAVLQSAAWDAL